MDSISRIAQGIGPQEDKPDLNKRDRSTEEKVKLLRYFQDKFGRTKRNPPPEKIYEILIQLELIKIVRERGRDPRVIWL